jgi:hypothetical protein
MRTSRGGTHTLFTAVATRPVDRWSGHHVTLFRGSISANRLHGFGRFKALGVLTTVDRKPPLSTHNLYCQGVPDWPRDEVMIYPSHVAGLRARLRDGYMTTRSDPVCAVKVPSEPSQSVANRAVTKLCAVPILDDWGERWTARNLFTEVFRRMWLTPALGHFW